MFYHSTDDSTPILLAFYADSALTRLVDIASAVVTRSDCPSNEPLTIASSSFQYPAVRSIQFWDGMAVNPLHKLQLLSEFSHEMLALSLSGGGVELSIHKLTFVAGERTAAAMLTCI